MKIELLTTVRGYKWWMKGEVLESPFHPDIQSIINIPTIAKVISLGEEKPKEEEKKPLEEVKNEIVKAPVIKKGNKKLVLKKGNIK